MKIPGILLGLLLALMAVQGIYFYSGMPAHMGTQFDRDGNARSWMGRGGFYAAYYGMAAFLGVLFLLVPLSSTKAPSSWDHGIQDPFPPRPGRNMAAIKAAVMWVGVGTLALLLGVGQLTFRANLGESARFRRDADMVLIGYGVFLAVWIVLFLQTLRSGSLPRRSGH